MKIHESLSIDLKTLLLDLQKEGIVRDEYPLSFIVKEELPGVILWEVIGHCCDLKFGMSSCCLINERREVDGSLFSSFSLSPVLISLFSSSAAEYFKDSKRKTSSCSKFVARSTKAGKSQGSRNLVIIVHCLQPGKISVQNLTDLRIKAY
uniref:Uncharacterized protein n=1 Tax=Glossina palpalis gambiensis TaxID=67801 RepID=A0A1B0AV67_9MUSC